jgi:hypothetical protein
MAEFETFVTDKAAAKNVRTLLLTVPKGNNAKGGGEVPTYRAALKPKADNLGGNATLG